MDQLVRRFAEIHRQPESCAAHLQAANAAARGGKHQAALAASTGSFDNSMTADAVFEIGM
jgi:hypothetical protein